MKSLTFMTQNRSGLLSDMSYLLGLNRINVEALEVDLVGSSAIINLTVRKGTKTINVLTKNGFEHLDKKGLLVCVPRAAEGLEDLRLKLEEKGILVKNFEVICSDSDNGFYHIQVDQPRRANKLISNILPLMKQAGAGGS